VKVYLFTLFWLLYSASAYALKWSSMLCFLNPLQQKVVLENTPHEFFALKKAFYANPELQAHYQANMIDGTQAIDLTYGGSQIALERQRTGDPSVAFLFELGFRLKKGVKQTIMQAPATFEEFVENFYRIYQEKLAAAGLEAKDALVPALIYRKPKDGGGFSYKFIRMGIDPLPSQDWQLTEKGQSQIPFADFARGINQGVLPMAISMLKHEVGHLFDLINIDHMQGTKSFYQQYSQQVTAAKSPREIQGIEMRAFMMGEFLALPNLSRKTQTFRMLENVVQLEGRSAEQVKKQVDVADMNQLIKLAFKLTKRKGVLLQRYGGAANDLFSLDRFIYTRAVKFIIRGQYEKKQNNASIAIQSLQGKMVQIEMLARFLQDPAGALAHYQQLEKRLIYTGVMRHKIQGLEELYHDALGYDQTLLKERMRELMGEVVAALYIGHKNQINVTDVIEYLKQENPAKSGPVYEFLMSYLDGKAVNTRALFSEDAR
jgi:hypothetical protein